MRIHHVTAISSDVNQNAGFYVGVLGLRLVKVTVNFDDPTSYHLYYGDELGRPGTVMTFFIWPGAARGRVGAPQVTATAFAIPSGSMPFWIDRLKQRGVSVTRPHQRFGQAVLALIDPDGLPLELIESPDAPTEHAWRGADVPIEHAIRGFHGVTISEEGYEHTARLLNETLEFSPAESEGNRFRFVSRSSGPEVDGSGAAGVVDLLCVPDGRRGSLGAGVVHHVAFRTANEAQQLHWRRTLVAARFNVSPVMDRNYFHSIYFREPGGVLFEIATDGPGFTADESAAQLGSALRLPRQYEALRNELQALLPKFDR